MFSAGPSMPTDIRAPQYTSQAAITPPSSESPSNQSPISPRSTFNVPAHLRMHSAQIKQPKGPLYVPAVLRPTEKPARCSPPKKNGFGSMDSGVNMDNSDPSLEAIGPGKINRLETELYNDEEMQEVTGSPSRNGWKVRLHSLLHPFCQPHCSLICGYGCFVAMPVLRCRFPSPRSEFQDRVTRDEVCLFASVNNF